MPWVEGGCDIRAAVSSKCKVETRSRDGGGCPAMPAITGNGAGTAQKNPESLARAFELYTLNFQLLLIAPPATPSYFSPPSAPP